MIIEFYDSEDSYGRIKVSDDTDLKLIERYLEEYRNNDEGYYNIDDFYLVLEERGIKFEIVNTDTRIWF